MAEQLEEVYQFHLTQLKQTIEQYRDSEQELIELENAQDEQYTYERQQEIETKRNEIRQHQEAVAEFERLTENGTSAAENEQAFAESVQNNVDLQSKLRTFSPEDLAPAIRNAASGEQLTTESQLPAVESLQIESELPAIESSQTESQPPVVEGPTLDEIPTGLSRNPSGSESLRQWANRNINYVQENYPNDQNQFYNWLFVEQNLESRQILELMAYVSNVDVYEDETLSQANWWRAGDEEKNAENWFKRASANEVKAYFLLADLLFPEISLERLHGLNSEQVTEFAQEWQASDFHLSAFPTEFGLGGGNNRGEFDTQFQIENVGNIANTFSGVYPNAAARANVQVNNLLENSTFSEEGQIIVSDALEDLQADVANEQATQAFFDAGFGSAAGLYSRNEMAQIQSIVNMQRIFGATPESRDARTIFDNAFQGMGARGAAGSERFRITFNPEDFGISRSSYNPILGVGQENRNIFEPTGPTVVEPAPVPIGEGQFLTVQERGTRAYEQNEINLRDAQNYMYGLNEQQLIEWQKRLWGMGLYGNAAIRNGAIPNWGFISEADERANSEFWMLVALDPNRDAMAVQNDKRREAFRVFSEVAQIFDFDDAGGAGLDVAGIEQLFPVRSEEELDARFADVSRAEIGERLSASELAKLKQAYRAEESEYRQANINFLVEQQQNQINLARQRNRRAAINSRTGLSKLYDQFGNELQFEMDPNTRFAPDTNLVEPVPFERTSEESTSLSDDYVGPNLIRDIEVAATPTDYAVSAMRRQQGSKVFARDMSSAVATLRNMMGT